MIRGIHDTGKLVATLTNKPFLYAAALDTEPEQVIEPGQLFYWDTVVTIPAPTDAATAPGTH